MSDSKETPEEVLRRHFRGFTLKKFERGTSSPLLEEKNPGHEPLGESDRPDQDPEDTDLPDEMKNEEEEEDPRPVLYEVQIKAGSRVGAGRGRQVRYWNRRLEYKKRRWIKEKRARQKKEKERRKEVGIQQ